MRARVFNWTFLAALLGGLAMAALGMVLLDRAEHLPPPPFTATPCIDDKFQFLHNADLRGINFVAIGSSVTLHSLDLATLKARFPQLHPLNAAPCHLHVDQAAFMADFLLRRMPEVHIVLTIVAPRDFEDCDPRDTAFFETWKAGRYVFDKHGAALVYLTGFRPRWFLVQMRILQRHQWTPFGSHPVYQRRRWVAPATMDPRCLEALHQFESRVADHGARLVVVTHPVMPAWAQKMDPDGEFGQHWYAAIRRALVRSDTVVIDGRGLKLSDEDFADPLHLLWPSTPPLAQYIADGLQREMFAEARKQPTTR